MNHQELLEAACAAQGWHCFGQGAVIAVSGGRQQRVFLETSGADGVTKVRVYTVIGTADALSTPRLEAALAINFHLDHGALALKGGELVMVETICLNGVDHPQLANILRYIAETADRYERTIYGTDRH